MAALMGVTEDLVDMGMQYQKHLSLHWRSCVSQSAHFDLESGTAFGSMEGLLDKNKTQGCWCLANCYARVACDYSRKNIAFHVDQGSNSEYFAVVIEFEEGDRILLKLN
ncbi:hypothetical protein HAX54_007188 [Datura stramonium]|uniref:Uncharacterized protein n=1 Tax=Datura stramonium TaxID=4076 RepID=A0ABS8TCM8_DATST|nr:hypothetical protein [Datura stramonium]